MKKLLFTLLGFSLALALPAFASTVFVANQGGTGTSTPSGILYGDNGSTNHLNTVTIGANCTFSGGTLNCTSSGGGSGTVSTSTNESAGTLSYWTSNSATPALLGKVSTSTLTPSAPLTGSFTTIGAGSLGLDTTGTWSGLAGTATKLATPRAINGVNFDGSAAITIQAASSTLLGDTNTFSGTNLFSNVIKIASLNGLIGGNSGNTYAISTTSMNASITGNSGTATALAANGTNCSAGNYPLGVDASGNSEGCTTALTNAGDWAGTWQTFSPSHFQTALGFTAVPTTRTINTTWPITGGGDLSADRTFAFGGLSTSTAAVQGNIPYFSGANTFANVATTTASCAGTASCTPFTVIGSSPVTITGSGSGSGTFPFSADTNFGQTVYSTSTPTLWLKSGLFASSTSYFNNLNALQATTTNFFVGTPGGGGDSFTVAGATGHEWSYGTLASSLNFEIASSTALGTTPVFDIAKGGNVGIGTSTPFAGLSLGTVANSTTAWLNTSNVHIGTSTCPTPNAAVTGFGLEVCGDDNSDGGVNAILGNRNAGTAAFTDLFMQNDASVGNPNAFAVLNFNSFGHTNTDFGVIPGTPRGLQLYNAEGPLQLGSATTSAADSYVQLFTGGTAASNERMRITAAGTVGIGTTTPNSNVALAVSGGCDGCTDIVLSQGINLLKAKYVMASTSGLVANTMTDLYTAPTGRKAIVLEGRDINATASPMTESNYLKSGGNYYKLQATSTINSLRMGNDGFPGIVLDPGESISIVGDTAGMTQFFSIIEFDAGTLLSSKKAFAPNAVFSTTTLYTVPTGKTAQITGTNFGFTNTGSIIVTDDIPSGLTFKWWAYEVPNGKSPSASATDPNALTWTSGVGTGSTAVVNASNSVGGAGPMSLNAGDSIQYAFDTNLAGTRSMLWINVFEH